MGDVTDMMLDVTRCAWVQDGDEDNYDTSCGNRFTINDGTPEDNDFKFCTYCGKPLQQHLFADTED